MYILEGQRVMHNKEVYKEYPENERAVAEFEYDVTKTVCQYLALYKVINGDKENREQIHLHFKS